MALRADSYEGRLADPSAANPERKRPMALPTTPHPGTWELLLNATTHAQDMDQRSVGLAFNPTNGDYAVTAPLNANVAPPGLYMLFVLRPKAASLSQATMIPSVAKIVNVKYPTP